MALPTGVQAPTLALQTTKGNSVILPDLLARGPVVLAFFKVSCPTCQYAFPYLERLFQVHKTEPLSFLGISQDNLDDTKAFMTRFGVTFPVAIDDLKTYRVSKQYELTNVPTVYLVDRAGEIQAVSVGWSRADIEEINQKLSMMGPAQQQHPVFATGESIAEFKAG